VNPAGRQPSAGETRNSAARRRGRVQRVNCAETAAKLVGRNYDPIPAKSAATRPVRLIQSEIPNDEFVSEWPRRNAKKIRSVTPLDPESQWAGRQQRNSTHASRVPRTRRNRSARSCGAAVAPAEVEGYTRNMYIHPALLAGSLDTVGRPRRISAPGRVIFGELRPRGSESRWAPTTTLRPRQQRVWGRTTRRAHCRRMHGRGQQLDQRPQRFSPKAFLTAAVNKSGLGGVSYRRNADGFISRSNLRCQNR